MTFQKRYTIITYGCQMNDYDSAVVAGLLEAEGWRSVENEAEADLIVVNTCSVRQGAEDRAIGRITNINKIKHHNRKDMVLCFMGCIAQQYGAQLAQRFPFIDLIVGTRDFIHIPRLVERVMSSREQIVAVSSIDKPLMLGVPSTVVKRPLRSSVTIMYGCNNFCTFCIVPYVRGREQSRPPHEILDEIHQRVHDGCRDIALLGQNVNSYRFEDIRLPDLLTMVNSVEGLWRIRFITSHPKDTTDRLIESIATLDKVCEHIHLPVQSGSSRILALMNRHYTKEAYEGLIARIRKAVPGIAITTDIMVGFPGETQEDFADTMDLVETVGFDSAFMFMYSPRPGTHAARHMEDNVPLLEKKERLARLIRLQNDLSQRCNQSLIGSIQEILVEGEGRKGGRQLRGRTRGDKVVAFEGDKNLIGSLVLVRITEAWPHTLFGTLERVLT